MEEVDLVVDLQIADENMRSWNATTAWIPRPDYWRNIIGASGAFPKDLSHPSKIANI